jgi:hypothetical protein
MASHPIDGRQAASRVQVAAAWELANGCERDETKPGPTWIPLPPRSKKHGKRRNNRREKLRAGIHPFYPRQDNPSLSLRLSPKFGEG